MKQLLITFLILLLSAPQAMAEDGAPEGAPSVQYIYFEPAFVVNFGHTGRFRFLRAEIALKVTSTEAAAKTSQHKPYLRHELVMLLSAQEPEVMKTSKGRESLRELALDRVKRTMKTLEGMTYVDDLFFNTFVVQN